MKLLALSFFLVIPASVSLNGDGNAYKKDGMGWIRDGHYISYYSNGNKKAEGDFKDNQRSGKWEVWDEAGQKRMERLYKGPYDFDIVGEYDGKGTAIDGTKFTKYSSKLTADGYIDYYKLKAEDILYSKRIWRMLEPGGVNELLFKDNFLYKVIVDGIFTSQELTPYSAYGDDFSNDMPFETLYERFGKQVNDPQKMVITGFKIKEDFFYDKLSKTSESRIIGICPVGTINDAPVDLFWIYMPELRKLLAAQKLSDKKLPAYIHTLDDVFYYSCFNSSIYKESNVYNRSIQEYSRSPEQTEQEIQRIELQMIDDEHDLWIDETAFELKESRFKKEK
jgi:gliding motility associated protien GldN